jgi:hypothetical protein
VANRTTAKPAWFAPELDVSALLNLPQLDMIRAQHVGSTMSRLSNMAIFAIRGEGQSEAT